MKKFVCTILALVMVVSLMACGSKNSPEADKKTSKDLGIFTIADEKTGTVTVVDKDGNILTGYAVDKDGNILNDKGEVIIAAADVEALVMDPAGLDTNTDDGKKPAEKTDAKDNKAEDKKTDGDKNAAGESKQDNTSPAAPGSDNSKTPSANTNTTKPSTPSTPSQPTNPTKPSNPTTPTNPTKPSTPTHKHSYSTKTVAATCTSGGYTLHTCSCGDSYKDNTTKALGHSYSSKVVAPTSSAKGYTQHTCSRCGDSYKDNYTDPVKPAHTHSYSKSVTKPTCTDDGYTTYTCSCGKSYTDNYTDALGHSWQKTSSVCKCYCGACFDNADDWGAHAKPYYLADEDGHDGYSVVSVYTCSRCGATK